MVLFGATGDLARRKLLPGLFHLSLGSWGPNAIHQLIAPDAWRLPFERGWRSN